MSGEPTFYGVSTSDVIPQANFRASGSETGDFTATQDFLIRPEYLDTPASRLFFKEGNSATALDPNLPAWASFLTLTHVDPGTEDGGWARVTAHYTGQFSFTQDADPDGTSQYTYTLSGALEEVSILEHPKVVALAAIERANLQLLLDGVAAWNVTDGEIGTLQDDGSLTAYVDQNITTTDGIAFATLIATGTTTYKKPVFTWSENTTTDTQFVAADLNALGYIDTPDGSPPTPNGTRNWLLIDAQSIQNGVTNPTFNLSRTWLLSDRGGHNATLYSA